MRGTALVGFVSVASLVVGCRTFQRADTPQAALARAGTGPIEVTRTDRSVVRITNASIVGDSLVGVTDDSSPIRIAMATKDVQSVAVRRVSAGRTAALGGGIIVGAVAAFGILIAIAVANLGNY